MAITASFDPGAGVLSELGDGLDNTITTSRDAAGTILIDGGGVPIVGGTATVANTGLIQAFGQGGNDTISLNEANGVLPAAHLFGGAGNDVLTGGSGNDLLFGQDASLGDGDDTFVWKPGEGNDTVDGQAGADTPQFNGVNVSETVTISAHARTPASFVMSRASRWTSTMLRRSTSMRLAVRTPLRSTTFPKPTLARSISI